MTTLADLLTDENRDEIETAARKNRRGATKYGHLLPEDR